MEAVREFLTQTSSIAVAAWYYMHYGLALFLVSSFPSSSKEVDMSSAQLSNMGNHGR